MVRSRTRPINQLRAILLKRGTEAPQGRRKLEERLPKILDDAKNGLWLRMRELLSKLRSEWEDLDRRILEIDKKLLAEAKGYDA